MRSARSGLGHMVTIDKVARSLARPRGLTLAVRGGRVPFAGAPMTIARQVIANRTYLISRRCTQRQFLLRPEESVEQIYLYCLGEAANRYDITLHAFIAMSNLQHIVVRDNHANFPEFLAHFHKMIAKAMNALRGRWENFWATEQPNAVYLVEPA